MNFTWRHATRQEDQFEGIDYFISRDGVETTVQLKCDRRIASTSNLFLQTTKVIGNPEKGKQVKALNFFYLDSINNTLYIMRTREIQANWNQIVETCEVRNIAQTNGTTTEGYIVPLAKIQEMGMKLEKVQL